jgi:hypothetical protein
MLFADDQVLLAKCEDYLQYSVLNLNKIASEFSTEINAEKVVCPSSMWASYCNKL